MEKFFQFIQSPLNYVDNGAFFRQPFKWLYYLLGVTNVLIPIHFITLLSSREHYGYYNDSGTDKAYMIILIILSIPIASFAGMIWINRGTTLTENVNHSSRFVAIPIIANLIQTFGEWLGFLVGVLGFVMVLLGWIFNSTLLSLPDWDYASPIVGYLIVVIARFLSESFLALASIANHTQSIDEEVKKIADK